MLLSRLATRKAMAIPLVFLIIKANRSIGDFKHPENKTKH